MAELRTRGGRTGKQRRGGNAPAIRKTAQRAGRVANQRHVRSGPPETISDTRRLIENPVHGGERAEALGLEARDDRSACVGRRASGLCPFGRAGISCTGSTGLRREILERGAELAGRDPHVRQVPDGHRVLASAAVRDGRMDDQVRHDAAGPQGGSAGIRPDTGVTLDKGIGNRPDARHDRLGALARRQGLQTGIRRNREIGTGRTLVPNGQGDSIGTRDIHHVAQILLQAFAPVPDLTDETRIQRRPHPGNVMRAQLPDGRCGRRDRHRGAGRRLRDRPGAGGEPLLRDGDGIEDGSRDPIARLGEQRIIGRRDQPIGSSDENGLEAAGMLPEGCGHRKVGRENGQRGGQRGTAGIDARVLGGIEELAGAGTHQGSGAGHEASTLALLAGAGRVVEDAIGDLRIEGRCIAGPTALPLGSFTRIGQAQLEVSTLGLGEQDVLQVRMLDTRLWR